MEMNSLLRLLVSFVMAAAVGCAPAYHSYGGCYVNCRYCPPPPLPYAHYEDCVCHSCAAAPYLNKWSPSVNQADGAPQPSEPHDDQASSS